MKFICNVVALTACIFYAFFLSVSAQVYYPDAAQPGKVSNTSLARSGSFTIGNNIIAVQFHVNDNKIQDAVFTGKIAHQEQNSESTK